MNDSHISYFKSILDKKGVIQTHDTPSGYEIGARGDKGRAALILRPKSTEEVSKILAYAYKEKLHIIAQSGNTGLVGGSITDESGTQILLCLERMNEIYDLDPANQSIHAGAGLRLSATNTALEKHKLHIPIDLGSDPCLGGMTSTNTGGSRYLKYRGMREQIMGVKAVLADEHGTIIDALIPLHKNNTGLDVKQLFIGTCGQLGIITEVIVRCSPTLQQSACALLIPSSYDAINPLRASVEEQLGTYLSAFEGMSGASIKAALDHVPTAPNPFGQEDIPPYAILLEISRSWAPRSREQSLDDILEQALGVIWEEHDTLLDNALLGDTQKLWALRHSISEGVQKSGKLFAFDVSVKRSDLMPLRARLEEFIATKHPELTLKDFGHIGDGAMHAAMVLDRDDPRSKDHHYEKKLREAVNDIVVYEFNGSYSAEHALGRKTQSAYEKYTPDEIRALCQAIKKAISPAPIGSIKL